MWLAKWFGRREARPEEDDEPPRVPPQQISRPVRTPPAPAQKPRVSATKPAEQGFDPYNSGAFERRNAWERVVRR
ncbi:MAG TPA: hypothetical protein VF193_11780 [Steroidobacter sp.]